MTPELAGALLFLVRVTSVYLVLALLGSVIHSVTTTYRYFRYEDDKKLLTDYLAKIGSEKQGE